MTSTDATPRSSWPKWIALAVVAVGVVVAVRALPIGRGVEALQDWVQDLGFLGVVAFGGAYLLAALLFVPGSAITLAAGAVFGIGVGVAVVSVASTTAAGIAFLIARYVARARVESLAARSPRFGAIDEAIRQGGWRIVALLRLSPAIPFSLANYLYGLTPLRFGPYVLTSWLAMLPGTFLYVYLGHAGAVGIEAASEGESGGRGWGEWALLGVGLAATLVVTVYITRLARRSLAEQRLGVDGDQELRTGPKEALVDN